MEEMKQLLYSTLNSIAPVREEQASKDNLSFPIIIYYFIDVQPLDVWDNSYSSSQRFFINFDIYSDTDTGYNQIIKDVESKIKIDLKGIKRGSGNAPLHNTSEGVFGARFEFEILDIKEGEF